MEHNPVTEGGPGDYFYHKSERLKAINKQLLETLEALVDDLQFLGYHTDDPVSGTDTVDIMCGWWNRLNEAITKAKEGE